MVCMSCTCTASMCLPEGIYVSGYVGRQDEEPTETLMFVTAWVPKFYCTN